MQAIVPKSYACNRSQAAPVIDGKLDDDAWNTAAWTTEFVDIEGDKRPKPRLTTRAKMLWDDQYLYIAAELEEPHVWATLTKHDAVIFQDNDFELFVDPDGDNHQYYEFEINALNTGWDLYLPKPYKDGGTADNHWEIAGLKTAVHVQGSLNDASDVDQGWTLELAIPWTAFQPPKLDQAAVQQAASLKPRTAITGESISRGSSGNTKWSTVSIAKSPTPRKTIGLVPSRYRRYASARTMGSRSIRRSTVQPSQPTSINSRFPPGKGTGYARQTDEYLSPPTRLQRTAPALGK